MMLALDSLTADMCKGFSVGETAGAAKDPLVYLQTVNKDFTDVDTVPIELGCTNCYMTYPDKVTLGSSIKTAEKCGSSQDTACVSACVSSWQVWFFNNVIVL